MISSRITSIYYSTKVNANTPDTFKSLEQGNLGAFLGGQPYYFFGPAYPHGRPNFDISNTTELPSVVILFGHRESLQTDIILDWLEDMLTNPRGLRCIIDVCSCCERGKVRSHFPQSLTRNH